VSSFCRIPTPYTEEEAIEREKKRLDLDDPLAIHNLGCDYRDGRFGYTQDYTKAFHLWHRAAELGHATAYGSIGTAYYLGTGVEVDKKKATHYYKLSAIEGNVTARYNLGNKELKAGDLDRAVKHFMIAVRGGSNSSLEIIKQLYLDGHATKEDYTKALRLYQEYLSEIKSVQRDKAAAFNSEKYQYY